MATLKHIVPVFLPGTAHLLKDLNAVLKGNAIVTDNKLLMPKQEAEKAGGGSTDGVTRRLLAPGATTQLLAASPAASPPVHRASAPGAATHTPLTLFLMCICICCLPLLLHAHLQGHFSVPASAPFQA